MSLLEKVLIPLDGTEHADRIVPIVLGLGVPREVTLLRVLPTASERAGRSARDVLDLASEHLMGLEARLALRGIGVRFEMFDDGDPAQRILDFASAWHPTLVALATHGRTGLSRLLHGSVAEDVLRACESPVLVANTHGLFERVGPYRPGTIVLPFDGTDVSLSVLPLVEELARAASSTVVVVQAVHATTVVDPAGLLVGGFWLADEELGCELVRGRLPGIPARTEVVPGSPVFAILDVARDERADLVVMTTHGRTGLSRWVLGSVAEDVIRQATCPVLVQRAAPVESVA